MTDGQSECCEANGPWPRKTVNSRRKGASGERELAAELTRLFGHACRRGQQYCGLEGQDVVGLPGIHIESKRVNKLNLSRAYVQAKRDAGIKLPIVCHRADRQPWMLTVALEDLPKLIELLKGS